MTAPLNTVELGQVCTKIGVGLAMAVTPFMTESGVKLIRNQNIRPNRFDDSSVVYLDPEFAAIQRNKTVRENDVVIVRTGANIGDACVVPKTFDGSQSFTTLLARPDKEQLHPHFLAQFVNSDFGRSEVERLMAGGGKGNLNSGELERFRITLLPIEEQVRVADVLLCWDSAIEAAEQLIAAKEEHYAHELSRLISRGHHPRSHVAPPAHVGVLGDLLVESREPDAENNPAKRLTVRLHLQGVEARGVRGTESDGATAYFRRRAGQLIYGKQNIFRGAIGIIPPELDGYTSSQDLPAFDISSEVDPQWLYYWLSRKGFYKTLESLAAGSGSKRLHPNELFGVRVDLPPLGTQTAIARYLNALREEIALLDQSVDAIKQQKRGLMQKLLTGQWRVKVPETEAA
jgi:type I restriction enzyme S subunit